jgi:nucleotide-binding universal stress UspA family protein
MNLIEKILFPTDFGESMDVALTSAVKIATQFESELILLHVLPENVTTDSLKSLVNERMQEFVATLKSKNVNCRYELLTGDFPEVIIKTAEREDVNLILLGAGKGRKKEFRLGSNSEKIIRKSSMPVWVIEKMKQANLDSILCPVDFSEESKLALDSAIHLSRRFNSKLKVLHVVKSYFDRYKEIDLNIASTSIEKETLALGEFLKEFNLTNLNWEKDIVLGDPANEIFKAIESENIGLLIMGATGKSGIGKLLTGSVTEKISRKVPCSFIITKSESLIQLKLEKNLSDIDALFNEGVQLQKDGYIREAITIWKKCTMINHLYLKAYGAIAFAYEIQGDQVNAKLYNDTKARIQRSIWDEKVIADLRSRHSMYK